MMRRLMISTSLGGVLLLGAAGAYSITPQEPGNGGSHGQQSQQATKSVSGKVTSIGDAGKSFSMEVNDGGSKKTLQFAVDKNTQVQGQVKAGTMVVVEYQPTDGGQLLAVSVSAQS
ncbi:MAG: hypothetical protein WCE52_04570 [Candidatus Acidiferrum sp.]